ncbi:MAG: hypothetical protein HY775_12445 [Acidobacteria bacterium]|nr:hypothetical protein [Acidobacteriota bacterium]
MDTEPVYCSCGAVLLDAATTTGVKPVGSARPIVFRRKTDFVICPECMTVYRVRSLLKDSPAEDSRAERPFDADVIEKLEKLAAEHPEGPE